MEILAASNDTRATPLISRMAQAPAIHGASTHSWLEGFTTNKAQGIGKTGTHYLQHVRYLGFTGADRDRRTAWLDEPGGWARAPDDIRAGARQGPPVRKTRAEVLRRMRAGELAPQSKLAPEDRGYMGMDAMTLHVPGWDPSRQFIDCSAHVLKNNASQAVQLMANADKMVYKYVRLVSLTYTVSIFQCIITIPYRSVYNCTCDDMFHEVISSKFVSF
jgi:hypothetical protein